MADSHTTWQQILKIFQWTGNYVVGSVTSTVPETSEKRLGKHFRDEKKTPGVTFTSMSVLESAPATHTFKKKKFQPAEPRKFFNTGSVTSTVPETSEKRLGKHFLDEKKTPGVTFTSMSVLESAPATHTFKKKKFQPAEPRKFLHRVRKEMALLSTSLPEGIMVKTFEDHMDKFSALIKGPNRTPYEDGLFLFDIQLPKTYPVAPPLFHYLSQCHDRLNPNLYDNGKVCVSLLGTWSGHGTETWTKESNLMQVLISIQGLILVNEPYYNEPGLESYRGQPKENEESRLYNERALIKMVQSMTKLLQAPIKVFSQEIQEHFSTSGWRLAHRLEDWLEIGESAEKRRKCVCCVPEPTDYPDIGFPLFPLSRGFMKSLEIVLSQYRAALVTARISEHTKDN